MFVLLFGQLLFGHGQRVVHAEVVDNDRYRHSNGQHTGQGTERTHQHPRPRLRVHISVAQRGHGHDGPPKPNGDVLEVGVGAGCWVVRVCANSFGIVDHGSEDEDTEGQEDDEQEELIGAGAKGVAEDTETHKVASELEDSEDTDESDDTEESQDILGSFGGQAAQAHLQIEGQDGDKVDDVEGAFEELQLIGAEGDSQQDLNGEPDDTHALHVCQPAVSHDFVHDLLARYVAHRDVLRPVVDGVEGLMRLHAESGDGDEDEE